MQCGKDLGSFQSEQKFVEVQQRKVDPTLWLTVWKNKGFSEGKKALQRWSPFQHLPGRLTFQPACSHNHSGIFFLILTFQQFKKQAGGFMQLSRTVKHPQRV